MNKSFCDVCSKDMSTIQSGKRLVQTKTPQGKVLQIDVEVYGAVTYAFINMPPQKEHRDVCWPCVEKLLKIKPKKK